MKLYEQVQISTLDNGLTVITDYNPQSRVTSAEIAVMSGGISCLPNKTGTAHFLEHMWAHAHPEMTNTQYRAWLQDKGMWSSCNFETGFDRTVAYSSASNAKARQWLDVVGDMIGRMEFSPDDVELERGVIVQEMRDEYASRHAWFKTEYMNKTYAGQPYAMSNGGLPEHLEEIGYSDLMAFYHKHYVGANMLVVSCGAISHEEMIAFAYDKFAHLPKSERAAKIMAHTTPHDFAFLEEDSIGYQTGLTIRYLADQYRGKDSCVRVLRSYLQSQVFEVLREQNGLVYSPSVATADYAHNGFLLGVTLSVAPADMARALELLQGIIRDVPNGLAQNFEMFKARMYENQMEAHVHSHSEPMERRRYIVEHYMEYGYVREPYEELERFMTRVTLDDVLQAYETIFMHQVPSMAYSGDVQSSTLMEGKDFSRGYGAKIIVADKSADIKPATLVMA